MDIAALRPDEWNLPLFLHVLGAMVLAGGVLLGLVYFAGAWAGRSRGAFRAGYRALLWGAIPGYVVMRGAAEWIYSKEFPEGSEDPSWIGIGYGVADLGLLLLVITTVVAGRASRQVEVTELGAEPPDDFSGTGGIRLATVISALLLVMYVVAIWAMTAKP